MNITNSKIHANDANFGGGIYNWNDAVIINTTIRNNKAGEEGGGIKSFNSLDIINSTVSGNEVGSIFSAHGCGGGICVEGDLKVTNCKINDNAAGEGGGIYRILGDYGLLACFIADSEITGNNACRGGGIYHTGNLVLEGVKVNDNFAWKGGGIYNTNGDIFKDVHTQIKGNWLRNIYQKK